MRRGLVLVSLLLLLPAATALGAPCVFAAKKHERHTTRAQKREAYRRAGVPWEKRACCVVDHRIPLELGGRDDVSNFQIQTKVEGHKKDLWENALAGCVCRGETPLALAQRAVVDYQHATIGTCPKESP